MTAVATRPAAELETPSGAPEPLEQRDSLSVRVAAFAALLAFATGHWAALVADPPALRTAALIVFLTAGGLALALAGRSSVTGRGRRAICAGISIVLLLGGLVIGGLALRLLWPGNWDELVDQLDRGLSAVQAVSWPYSGGDEPVRVTVLLGAPLMGGLAAVMAFWPARRHGGVLRALALVSLLTLYAVAVTEHDLGRPLLRGAVLLVLVAAWLWLPRLAPREAVAGAAAVLAVGALALPLSAGLDADSPWWDYRSWDWLAGEGDIAFDWNHSYGPMDWPREGTTLLNVRTNRPTYLKAETLDRFDGRRWVRGGGGADGRPAGELPPSVSRRWGERRIRVTVRALRTDFVVGTGTPLAVEGAGPVRPSADGTVTKLGEPLEKGEAYDVRAYVPEPRPAQMRAAEPGSEGPASSYFTVAGRYMGVALPATAAPGPGASRPVFVAPRGLTGIAGTTNVSRELAESPYARTYRLARRLTQGAPTTFDAVRGVERYLEKNMRYDEGPPERRFPLEAFLFEDKIGYCQQFSGAMALMLRMSGIPARVVSGFSPGVRDLETRNEYKVRDLDAHSWVEVYFAGIGWVTFDPTPPVAPAQSQVPGFDLGGGDRDAGEASTAREPAPRPERDGGRDAPAAGRRDGGSGPGAGLLALFVVGAVGTGLLVARRSRSLRPLDGGASGDARLRELERALPRVGLAPGPGTTLLGMERLLRGAAGPSSARYVARLRAHRYAPRSAGLPDAAARRALRRELGSAGLRSRLRALRAIPPWGPRS